MKWYVINDEAALTMLKRAANGEDPDLVWIEYVANATPPPENE